MNDSNQLMNLIINQAFINDKKEIISRIKDDNISKSFSELSDILNELNLKIVSNNTHSEKDDLINEMSNVLSKTFFAVYYVNIHTGKYVGYNSNDEYNNLSIASYGDDFFSDSKNNIPRIVFKDDVSNVINAFKKDNIITSTLNNNTFSITYRILMNNEPTYIEALIFKLSYDEENIVIGLKNITDIKVKELEYKENLQQNITYTNIALALARNYFAIYYVDVRTNDYIEYTIDYKKQTLKQVSSGIDFFADSLKNARKHILKEDQEKFIKAIDRENFLKEIASGSSFSITYRQILNGTPQFVIFTAQNLTSDSNHVILAVRNINSQMLKEEEYRNNLNKEKMLARTDGLTGALNKFSYVEKEKEINNMIESNQSIDFAIVVCDINNLKTINDTYGHEVGDRYIIEAKELLANIFTKSNIYRTGGDEFVIILLNDDYTRRYYLLNKIKKRNTKNINTNKLILACGCSKKMPNDSSVGKVFKRADEEMYKNKNILKKTKK